MVEPTSNCIGWDSGPTLGNPTDRHFLMLQGQLSSCWSSFQNILLLGFTTETKVRVCNFLGSQCSMLSASSCLVPISIHLQACHNSYRLSTFANCYKVFNAPGGGKIGVMLKSTARCADMSTTDDTTFQQLGESILERRHSEASPIKIPFISQKQVESHKTQAGHDICE